MKCDICRKDIERYHSYHATGNATVHMACVSGHTPASNAYERHDFTPTRIDSRKAQQAPRVQDNE